MMRFEVLGPLRVTAGDEAVPLGNPQQQRLLALLLSSANQVVSTDRLIDEMWGDDPPSTARHLVQDYVWRLRTTFAASGDGPRIDREGLGYVITVDREELDALQLAATVEEARRLTVDDMPGAEKELREATSLWRGTPFGDLADDSPLLGAEVARLEELYLGAMADWIGAALELGLHRDLVGELERLTERHPYREQFWGQLMLVHYRCGRQAEALRAYQKVRRTLGDELGIEPGPDLQELEERILLHDPELLWEPPPPPSTLPRRLTTFVGRAEEIAEIVELIDVFRLVTLTGPGGIGKTRLAIEAADRTLFDFADGIWWVDFAAATDPDGVIGELATALGVTAQPGMPLIETVTRSLARRKALLVFDNCEHLVSGVAALLDYLLHATDGVHVMATSRIPLGVAGEALWTVPSLAMPLSDETAMADARLTDAVSLFIERGTVVDRMFDLSEDNVGGVIDICRRLDGLPLAIEMAAARLRVLTPVQISQALDNRFNLLGGGERQADTRHQTLQAALDWSYDLLDPVSQESFDRLSVFAGPFDLEAADAVARPDDRAPPILDIISQLVGASMLGTIREVRQVRYRLLETLREYGYRHLLARGDERSARDAHAGYYLALTERAGEETGTPGFAEWVRRLVESYDDLKRALAWLLEGDTPAMSLRAAPALFHFWFRTGDAREAGRVANQMLQNADEAPSELVAAAHLCAAFGANVLGPQQDAEHHIHEAIHRFRASGDRRGLATALFGKGNVALRVGDFETMAISAEEALAIGDEIGDRWNRAGPLSLLSFVQLFGGGSLDDARLLADEALALYRELGDAGSQVVLNPLTSIALQQGDVEAAERYALDSLAVAAGTGWEASALVSFAEVLIAKNDTVGAGAILGRGLKRALDTGLENWFRIALRDLAQVAVLDDEPLLGAQLIGASRRDMPAYGLVPTIYEAVETKCRTALGEGTFAEATKAGYEMTHEQLLALALDSEQPQV